MVSALLSEVYLMPSSWHPSNRAWLACAAIEGLSGLVVALGNIFPKSCYVSLARGSLTLKSPPDMLGIVVISCKG